MNHNIIYFFAFFTSFIIAYLLIPKIIHIAKKNGYYDIPGERASHENKIPFFGGIGIFVGIAVAMLAAGMLLIETEGIHLEPLVILTALFFIFIVGILDDLSSFSPTKKMIGQLIAIFIIYYYGDFQITKMYGVWGINVNLPDWISLLFTAFTVIVITNAYNLIDGIDGLAGGVGIIASTTFGIINLMISNHEMAILSFVLTGSLLAYLKYNFCPARIFMGDAGSLVVGFILSVLAIDLIRTGFTFNEIHYSHGGVLMAISILAIPLFDSLRVFVIRSLQGNPPLYADRNHIHHALIDLEFSHKKTAIIIYIASVIMIFLSLLLLEMNINFSITLLALIAYFSMTIPFFILKRREKTDE